MRDGSNLYIYGTIRLRVNSSIVRFVTMIIVKMGSSHMGVVSSAVYGDDQLSDTAYESMMRLLIISPVNVMKILSLFSNNVTPHSMVYTESRKGGFIHYIPFTQSYDLTKLINTIMKIENLEPSNVPNTLLTLTKEPH